MLSDKNESNTEPASDSLSMPPELMKELAEKTTDLLISRIVNLPQQAAWNGEFSMELSRRFDEEPPEEGTPPLQIIEKAANEILPISLSLDHPKSFGFVPTSPTWPGILADYMSAAFNVNNCVWLISSGPSAIELLVLRWFCSWIGYPDTAGGVFTSGGSAAALDAFVAARENAGYPDRATVYMSDQSHSAQIRAAKIIGIHTDCLRLIPCDDEFQMDCDELAKQISEDKANGFNPIVVSANAGSSNTGSIDPLNTIVEICERENIWFHVDAAYGGFAIVTEQGKRLLNGIERADSISIDAHKWFFQPYEAGCLLVKDLTVLEQPFGFKHDVLQDTIWGANHPNFSDRGSQLSRPTRAIKVWVSVKTFGMRLFREAISKGIELARAAEQYVVKSEILELLCPVTLSIVCFRVNAANMKLDEEALNDIN